MDQHIDIIDIFFKCDVYTRGTGTGFLATGKPSPPCLLNKMAIHMAGGVNIDIVLNKILKNNTF